MRAGIRLLLGLTLLAVLLATPALAFDCDEIVPAGHWAYGVCAYLQCHHALEAYPAGAFSGECLLTNAEFHCAAVAGQLYYEQHKPSPSTKVLLAMLDWEFMYPPTGRDNGWLQEHRLDPDSFRDVPANCWTYAVMQYLVDREILMGFPDGYFNGTQTLTYWEFVVATARATDPNREWSEPSSKVDEPSMLMMTALKQEFAEGLNASGGFR
jgi:hypothetical protein